LLESGRAVVIRNWLPAEDLRALRADAEACYADGAFCLDALAASRKAQRVFTVSDDRHVMPSFFASRGTDGPWVNDQIGDSEARRRFKARVASLKASLANQLFERPSLAVDASQTHECAYTRYGPGACLGRHTDEHHGALKKAHPVASGDENLRRLATLAASSESGGERHARAASAQVSLAPSAPVRTTRRSVTWLVYLNEGYDAVRDGGQLRVHERALPSMSPVGARKGDLQIGWLRATATQGETPVFLDASRTSFDGSTLCMLYVSGNDGVRRELSARPFAASPTLFLAGSSDLFARRLGLMDSPTDAERFHLLDVPKSAASTLLARGDVVGERIRTIEPEGGTLVLYDSVSLPHEVLPTRSERFAVNGWFHEQIAYS
jgi:hypothetical protein